MKFNFIETTQLLQLLSVFAASIILTTWGIRYFLKNPDHRLKRPKAFISLMIICIGAYGIYHSIKYSDDFYPPEYNTERVYMPPARGYVEEGFFSNYGKPNVWYGVDIDVNSERMKEAIGLSLQRREELKGAGYTVDKYVPGYSPYYTSLPIGDYWIAGLLMKACGENNFLCFRLILTAFNVLMFIIFAKMLLSSFSPIRAAIILFAVLIIPMTRNLMWVLHYYSYMFSLFLLQLGLLIYIFRKNIKLRVSHIAALFFLGFVQGYISFEYFFLIAFCAVPLALLYCPLDNKAGKKKLFYVCLLPVLGFCFAFVCHLIQNSLFFGSLDLAIYDLLYTAVSRGSSPGDWGVNRFTLLLNYFFYLPRQFNFFAIDFSAFTALVLILIWFKDVRLAFNKPIKINLVWSSSMRNYYVVFSSFIVTYSWIVIMSQYASYHPHIVPRLLFFFYFVCVLTVLECVSVDRSSGQSDVLSV